MVLLEQLEELTPHLIISLYVFVEDGADRLWPHRSASMSGANPHGTPGQHVLPPMEQIHIPCASDSTELAVMPMFERTFHGPIAASLPQQ